MPPTFDTFIQELERRLSHQNNGLLHQLWDITTQHATFHVVSKLALKRESCLNNRYLKQLIVLGHLSRHCLGLRSILFDHQSGVFSLKNTIDFLDKNNHLVTFENFIAHRPKEQSENDRKHMFAKFCDLKIADCTSKTRIPELKFKKLRAKMHSAMIDIEPYITDNFAHKKTAPRSNDKEWRDLDNALLHCWDLFLDINTLRYDGSTSPIGIQSGDLLYKLDLPALDRAIDSSIFEEEADNVIADFFDRYSLGQVTLPRSNRRSRS